MDPKLIEISGALERWPKSSGSTTKALKAIGLKQGKDGEGIVLVATPEAVERQHKQVQRAMHDKIPIVSELFLDECKKAGGWLEPSSLFHLHLHTYEDSGIGLEEPATNTPATQVSGHKRLFSETEPAHTHYANKPNHQPPPQTPPQAPVQPTPEAPPQTPAQPTPEAPAQPTPQAPPQTPPQPTPESPPQPTPEAPAQPTPEAPAQPTPEAPAQPTPEVPAQPAPQAPPQTPPQPTPESPAQPTPQAPPQTPPQPTPESPPQPTPEAPAQPTPEAPAQPTPEAPAQPTPEVPAQPAPQAPPQTPPQPTPEAPAQPTPQAPPQTPPQPSTQPTPQPSTQPTPQPGASQSPSPGSSDQPVCTTFPYVGSGSRSTMVIEDKEIRFVTAFRGLIFCTKPGSNAAFNQGYMFKGADYRVQKSAFLGPEYGGSIQSNCPASSIKSQSLRDFVLHSVAVIPHGKAKFVVAMGRDESEKVWRPYSRTALKQKFGPKVDALINMTRHLAGQEMINFDKEAIDPKRMCTLRGYNWST